MDVREFFTELAKVCDEGKCPQCGARIFCYTAPRSMTDGIISQAIEMMDACGMESSTHKAAPIHSNHYNADKLNSRM